MRTLDDASKLSNPKDAVGVAKAAMSCLPNGPLYEAALGMFEGALKYGRHNYRIAGVRNSVYYDAINRHLKAWWEGEDIDPDTLVEDPDNPGEFIGIPHLSKIVAGILVLRDAQMAGLCTDDRPPTTYKPGWIARFNSMAKGLLKKYPNPKAAFTIEDTPREV